MILKEIVTVEDLGQNKVKVKFQKSKMCSCCRLSFLCGKQGEETIEIDNPEIALTKGDKVEVGIERKKPLLMVMAMLYMIVCFPMMVNEFYLPVEMIVSSYGILKKEKN